MIGFKCQVNKDLKKQIFQIWLIIIIKIGRETIELVKDAIEFCDNVPIVYEDQRVKDKTAAIKVNSDKPAAETTKTYSINNEPILVDPVVETTSNISTDLVLQFTDLQRKQLDEQLRTVSYFLVKHSNNRN